MRTLLGVALLMSAGLFGVDRLTAQTPKSDSSAIATLAVGASSRVVESLSDRRVVETVAAAEPMPPLPQVRAAPENAPRAEPINPIVAPVPQASAKSVAPNAGVAKPAIVKGRAASKKTPADAALNRAKVANKSKPAHRAVSVTPPAVELPSRPGFKLSCTAAQKLDVARHRCIPLKR